MRGLHFDIIKLTLMFMHISNKLYQLLTRHSSTSS